MSSILGQMISIPDFIRIYVIEAFAFFMELHNN